MIITIIIISLFCNGLFLISKKDYILGFLDRWVDYFLDKRRNALKDRLGDINYRKGELDRTNDKYVNKWLWFYNPVFGCITCMSSVWGFLIYWYFNPQIIWIDLIIIIISSAFLNTLLYKIYEKNN